MRVIAFVIADPAVARALTEHLESDGLVCVVYASLETALRAWKERPPEAAILDSALCHEPFHSEIERITATTATHFLFLGAPPVTQSEKCLFVDKPARLPALLAKIRLILSRNLQQTGKSFPLGNGTFLPDEKTILGKGGEMSVKLTDKESELLLALCEAKDPLPRDTLLQTVWKYEAAVDTHTVETHIYNLRTKLAALGADDPFCVDPKGYSLSPAWMKQG